MVKKDEMLFEKANNLTFDFRNPLTVLYTVWKVSKYEVFFWSEFWHFSRSDIFVRRKL